MPTKGRTWRKRRNTNENTASLAHKPEYIALFQWAKQNGVFFHKMKPAVFPGTGRGLMATRRIEVGNLLISVPKRLLVGEQIPRNSCLGQLLHQIKAPDLHTMELLCLFLILERNLHHQSFWAPYISMLPSHFNTSAYFDRDELKHAPEFFADHGCTQLKRIRKCHSSLIQFISNSCQRKVKNVSISFEDVRWAWNVVNTRCVYMRKQSKFGSSLYEDAMSCSLAPLLDLLNHSCDVQIEADYSDLHQCYQIFTKTEFKKGDQVFINYGPHANRKLLVEYGFFLPYNCHNSVKIEPKLVYNVVVQRCGDICERKYNIIKKYNLEETFYCSPNGLSWSLETALKILSLNDAKLEQRSFQIDGLELSIEKENLVLLFSKEILNSILGEYRIDIRRMFSISENKNSLTERMQQLLALLEQEKDTVENALIQLD